MASRLVPEGVVSGLISDTGGEDESPMSSPVEGGTEVDAPVDSGGVAKPPANPEGAESVAAPDPAGRVPKNCQNRSVRLLEPCRFVGMTPRVRRV